MSFFRKSTDQTSLKINTNPFETTSRVRQRFSSWFTSPKSKRSSLSPTTPHFIIHNQSSTSLSSSSSDVSDPMPVSPIDIQPTLWQKEPEAYQQTKQEILSLADQVRLVLGSTLDEVDEEIDRDWEQSRAELDQSLVLPANERIIIRL